MKKHIKFIIPILLIIAIVLGFFMLKNKDNSNTDIDVQNGQENVELIQPENTTGDEEMAIITEENKFPEIELSTSIEDAFGKLEGQKEREAELVITEPTKASETKSLIEQACYNHIDTSSLYCYTSKNNPNADFEKHLADYGINVDDFEDYVIGMNKGDIPIIVFAKFKPNGILEKYHKDTYMEYFDKFVSLYAESTPNNYCLDFEQHLMCFIVDEDFDGETETVKRLVINYANIAGI